MNIARMFSANDFTGGISRKKASEGGYSIIHSIRQVFLLQAEICLLINYIIKNVVFCWYSLLQIFFLTKGLARTVFIKYVADLLGRNRQLQQTGL